MDSTRLKNRLARRALGGPHPFGSDAEVLEFAKLFLRQRAWDFKKNLDICLTTKPNNFNKRDHAYMPGLLITVAFIDLLSGLYAGDIENHNRDDFLAYMRRFMAAGRYSDANLRLLYIGFRHKIAHLSHPYFVLDTSSERRLGLPPMRIVWTIYAAPRNPPIELIPYPVPQTIRSQPTPWPVPYDHRINVSIATLARDARKSLKGPNGYVAALADPDLLRNFKQCMPLFYPR